MKHEAIIKNTSIKFNWKVELQNGMTFICNSIEEKSNNVYTITIGDSVSFIPTADVRWIDPTFQATECLVNRNQADRVAVYVAVSSKSILVKYQMPNGKVFHNRIFANNTYKAIKL